MNYPDSIDYLYALGNEHKAFKLGLEPVGRLLRAMGNPQNAFRAVHVAGTNGKGSTCAFLEAGLRDAGTRTGLFTSPHLVQPTERIQIAGSPVSPDEFARAFDEVHEAAEQLVREGVLEAHPSYFETVTAMAFHLFREKNVETGVIEVGLGGRLDATNVIQPVLCVITPIDYDHEAWLGSSLTSIAGEKAGILKAGVPAVFSTQREEAAQVLNARAAELGIPVYRAGDQPLEIVTADAGGSTFRYGSDVFRCNLPGAHQAQNAATAITALRVLGVPEPNIHTAIATAQWPGRLERISRNPDIVLDGAHNPAGARALAAYLREFYADRRVVLIYGALRDKSIEEITETLFPLASEIIATAPKSPRALAPAAIAVGSEASKIRTAPDLESALAIARGLGPEAIFVTGSLYLVGEARALLVK